MYTYEIDSIIKQHNFTLPSYLYLQICRTSPQISHVRYNAWDSTYEISTCGGGYWKFKVYHMEKE